MTPDRLDRLSRSLELALNQEWPQLDRTRNTAAALVPVTITPAPADSRRIVATVATDGGESRLTIEPIRIQAVRVADSLGVVHFEEFIPLSLRPEEIIRFFFAGSDRLRGFLADIGLRLDALLPQSDYQRGNLLAMLRELLEWAALIDVAASRRSLLLLRDGLLRSVLLGDVVFDAIHRRLRDLTARNGHLLAGVAKRSAVLSYLAVALGDSAMDNGRPSYVRVSEQLERESAPAQYRWVGQRNMGALHIARLDDGPNVPMLPIDVAAWQARDAGEMLSLLARSGKGSFPIRGYPMELLEAHRHAALGALQGQMLESMLMDELSRRNPAVARRVRELRLLGRRLVEDLDDGTTRD